MRLAPIALRSRIAEQRLRKFTRIRQTDGRSVGVDHAREFLFVGLHLNQRGDMRIAGGERSEGRRKMRLEVVGSGGGFVEAQFGDTWAAGAHVEHARAAERQASADLARERKLVRAEVLDAVATLETWLARRAPPAVAPDAPPEPA